MKQTKLKIGPVLPYNEKAFSLLEISNSTQYTTEIMSLDFDKKFRDDIEMLTAYEELQNGNNEKEKRVVYLPIREAGAGIWNEVTEAINKKNKIEELKKELENTESEE